VTTKPEPEALSYERAVDLFDAQLRILEEGNLTLDEAIKAVDEAARLLRTAERKLEEARARIEVRPPAVTEPEPEPAARGRPAAQWADETPPPRDEDAPFPEEELPF
jgi:exodeoxyribonuclease VII small subunit